MNLCLHVISKKQKTHPNKSKRSRVLILYFWYFLVFLMESPQESEKLSPQECEQLSPQESEKLSPQESEKLSPHADPPSFFLVPVTSTSSPISRQFPAHLFISLQFLFVSHNFFLFPSSGSLRVLHAPAVSILVSLQRRLHFLAIPFTSIKFTLIHSRFSAFPLRFLQFSECCFIPLLRIASIHSIICVIRDDAGNAWGVVQLISLHLLSFPLLFIPTPFRCIFHAFKRTFPFVFQVQFNFVSLSFPLMSCHSRFLSSAGFPALPLHFPFFPRFFHAFPSKLSRHNVLFSRFRKSAATKHRVFQCFAQQDAENPIRQRVGRGIRAWELPEKDV